MTADAAERMKPRSTHMSLQAINLVAVDTDPAFLARLEAMLAPASEITVLKAESGQALRDLLNTRWIDCVLLDYQLGPETALTLIERFKGEAVELPPVILVTGAGSEEIAVKAFRAGIADYVTKQTLDGAELVRVVRAVVAAKDGDVNGIDAAAPPVPHRDAVAGFASRLQVEDCLRRLETAGNGQPYAIIALRPRVFDDLLHTGDTPLGNDIIAEFGRRVTDATRLRDVRGCWDDSTFVCVLEQDATRASIQQLCAGLAVRLKFPFQSKAWSFAVEAEIGSATFAAGDGTAIAALGLAVDAIGRAAGTASSGLSASAAESSTTPVSDPMPAPPADLPPFSSGQVPAGVAERVTERRMASRHRVLKRGRIGINNLHSTIDCTVRNLSEQGALLRIEGFFAAPRRFHLSIGDDFKRDVWLRWQNGSEAGVSFTPIEEPSPQA
jgi:CheY-like chemotaxis protein/GGDEF domain-containing protein